ncbi:uncharacterized protein LOC130960643 isoform X1 [Arachis stenosperma]|uniref:uncharacterized protein LOC130960643 isoform X1 n=1 Tax=Arachis stenosperma TaxID=217475 RepID=UPI0025ABB880|nr:uncharacterized protein LOC130960643 isoform X1 [Arachis stenosperma]
MAENLDDGEFWLPPQFLTNDDTPLNNINDFSYNHVTSLLNRQNDVVSRQMLSYGSSYPYSPVESSETESSDEEEHHHHQIADLTRRVAHTKLGLDFHHHHSLPSQIPKSVVVSGSPQSTLCGCGGRGGSSSSPNSGCHVTSQRATWDLLRAAAGEVERMRLGHPHLNDNFTIERCRFDHNNNTSVVVPPTNPGIVAFNNNSHHHLSATQQKLQVAQFEMLRQQQLAKQQQGSVPVWCGAQNRGRSDVGSVGVRNIGSLCDAAAWPSMQAQQHAKQQNQQQYGSGMRAVFLGNPKRESAGTGVFLPRRVDRAAESKKKSGCSTVLVPARVVQALNLKLEDMVPVHNHHHSRSNVTSNMENAAGSTIPRIRSNYNYGFSHQKRNNLRPQPQVNHEIRLPQEWTY